MENQLLSATEAAKYLGMSYAQFYARVRPFVKYQGREGKGNWRYYRPFDLDQWERRAAIDPLAKS